MFTIYCGEGREGSLCHMYVVCYLCRTADYVLYVSNTNFLRDNKVLSYLILSYLILSYLILSYLSYLILSYLILSYESKVNNIT